MKARRVEGLDPSVALRSAAAKIVAFRLDELCGCVDEALTPGASRAQHDTRIAAKRLRYLLEIFEPCLGEEAKAARSATKQMQSVLGDLHDCDLMLPKVEHIASLAALLRERRERLFRQFVEQWQAEVSKGTWAALEQT